MINAIWIVPLKYQLVETICQPWWQRHQARGVLKNGGGAVFKGREVVLPSVGSVDRAM